MKGASALADDPFLLPYSFTASLHLTTTFVARFLRTI